MVIALAIFPATYMSGIGGKHEIEYSLESPEIGLPEMAIFLACVLASVGSAGDLAHPRVWPTPARAWFEVSSETELDFHPWR